MPNFTFYVGRENKTTIFFFSFVNLETVLENSTPKKFANIWRIKRVGIGAMKFETARIHFLGDDFATEIKN